MKIFIYKTLFVFVLIFVLFQLTIGAQMKKIEYRLNMLKSKENISLIKDKLREELQKGVEKDQYLNKEDAQLINKFINKIKKELENN
tara:strand:- start:82 stop:342 length:261 start_codon:yes stop_codon:yes gene_type:complete